MLCLFPAIKQRICFYLHVLQSRVLQWIKPPTISLVLGTFADLTRGKAELVAENALLRQQLIILRRQVKRPVCRKTDRLLLVLLARMVQTWKQALFLIQPETDLALASGALPRVLEAQIQSARAKTKALARDDCLGKAKWQHTTDFGEQSAFAVNALSLDIQVSKRTIQKYMKQIRAISRLWTDVENVLAQSRGRNMGL